MRARGSTRHGLCLVDAPKQARSGSAANFYLVNIVLLVGVILAMSGSTTLLLIGIAMMAVTVLFTLITLPVEFDASRRALAWLNNTNVTNNEEYPKAKDALKWAAMTYVVAALAAVVTLVQYIMIYLGSRDRS